MSTTEVTVTATKTADPSRRVRLTIGLRDAGSVGFALADGAHHSIEPLDELSATYDLENWKSGLLSGYFFVCRRAKRVPPPPLALYELSGSLGSDDMHGVVKAAEAAAASLFGVEPPTASTEWVVNVSPVVPEPVTS